jgi:pyruvate,water dikinase
MRSTGLSENLVMTLYRKAFNYMRWEEIWDTALRIRNLFLQTEIPDDLRVAIASATESSFAGKAVSVRSSAPGEDSSKTSFAGLHESFVNISGTESILKHVRLVWASLWSDRALLYRQELGLDVEKSTMAVVVQEMIPGERSGVVFGRSPTDESQAVIEAVYGLNQGLVDGTVEPDRWILGRHTGEILSHTPARREKGLNAALLGTRLENLPPELREKAPLVKSDVSEVFQLAMKAESLFKSPQDVEWTYRKNRLHSLQARPITTGTTSDDEERLRYLGLHRSFENLKTLRTKIEKDLLPAMESDAAALADTKLAALSHVELADEIERRTGIQKKWVEAYWQNCIPFAHGMRMFGQIYNDVVSPQDPFEFVDLLRGTRMVSMERNQNLEELAVRIRKDPPLAECLRLKGLEDCDPVFREAFDNLSNTFGELAWGDSSFIEDRRQLLGFVLEIAARPPANGSKPLRDIGSLEANFLSLFEEAQKKYATEMLDLARASYRLRDDDNIYLGKIEGQMRDALIEGKKRLKKIFGADLGSLETPEILKALRNGHNMPTASQGG